LIHVILWYGESHCHHGAALHIDGITSMGCVYFGADLLGVKMAWTW